MYSSLQLTARYIRYYCTAANGKGHGIHSPFVYNFIRQVLNDKRSYKACQQIAEKRQQLLQDSRLIKVQDFGAGSVTGNTTERQVSSIAKNAAKSKKMGELLFRIAQHYKPASMLELGTSLGLSAAYLASGHPAGQLTTLEGAPAIAEVAQENFSALGIRNAKIKVGQFDERLPGLLATHSSFDLAFIDGNHRKLPTLRYFEMLLPHMQRPGILIFDDIHWSREMEAAWQEIKAHNASMLTIDLFFTGFVFLNTDFKIKQHFVIRF